MKFKENVSLAKFSNYKIGGNARFFFEPKNDKEVGWAVREACARKLPIFVLGGGTNLLISDAGFDGLVLRMGLQSIVLKNDGSQKSKTRAAGKNVSKGTSNAKVTLEVGAGVLMAKLLDYSVTKSLSGLEWAGGLPGTFGGAIRGNAGCFGGEMKDAIVSVRSFDTKKMKVVTRGAKACKFGYRDSVFKHGGAGASGRSTATGAAQEIILSATLAMKKGDKKKIAQAIKEKIDYRARTHPLEYPNIGSIFKNIPLARWHEPNSKKYLAAVAKQSLEFRGSQFSIKTDPFPVVSTAKLISETGLRGVSFGGAMISPKHPNFIVNALEASSGDVKKLILLAKAEVKRKFGVVLEEEIQTI